MHLKDTTEIAYQNRIKVAHLLASDDMANVGIGLHLIKEGGWTWELVVAVFEAFRRNWRWINYKEYAIIKELDPQLDRDLHPSVARYFRTILDHVGGWGQGSENSIFGEGQLFNMLVDEGITTWQGLMMAFSDFGQIRRSFHLTQILLSHLDEIDPNGFIVPAIENSFLHQIWMKPLFELQKEGFRRLDFMRQYLHGNRLDLSNTGIDHIPIDCAELGRIEIIDIMATKVVSIPMELFPNLREVIASKEIGPPPISERKRFPSSPKRPIFPPVLAPNVPPRQLRIQQGDAQKHRPIVEFQRHKQPSPRDGTDESWGSAT
ncbi:MAG: hypothetical protein U0176_20725 [Bacteroidia bacterium]